MDRQACKPGGIVETLKGRTDWTVRKIGEKSAVLNLWHCG
jgi:hypothetical protein